MVPANAVFINTHLITVATFDPIPVEWIWMVLSLPSQESFGPSFEACGYDFAYTFENFGSGTVIIHASLVFALIILVLPYFPSQKIVAHPKFEHYKRSLFFGGTLRFLYEGFLQLAIAVAIMLSMLDWDQMTSFSERYCIVWAFIMLFGLAIVALVVPIYYKKNYRLLD